VKSESAYAGAHARAATSSRSLSTARAALRVLSMLAEQPSGVRADEVAHALGKSTSTAYYLLTSLCEEGFAVHESKGLYRPARGLEQLTLAAEQAGPVRGNLKGTVDKLFLRTRRRSYLGALRDGRIEVVLALLGTRGVSRYIARGLKPFTPHTITSADVLLEDLERVRRRGFAVDREEFDENFCCVAAPIFDDSGRFLAALGMSMTRHVFDTELDPLAAAVVDVANLQTDAKNRRFLSPVTPAPTLSSAAEAVAGP
jgi:DNA-binding IclR family transcriptional regulator